MWKKYNLILKFITLTKAKGGNEMYPNGITNLQSKAVNEVRELVKKYITKKAEKKRFSDNPFVKKYGLFFEVDYGEVYGIVIRGNYSLRNEVIRDSITHEVMAEIWDWIPDYANSQGYFVKKPGSLSYVLYDRGGNFA